MQRIGLSKIRLYPGRDENLGPGRTSFLELQFLEKHLKIVGGVLFLPEHGRFLAIEHLQPDNLI